MAPVMPQASKMIAAARPKICVASGDKGKKETVQDQHNQMRGVARGAASPAWRQGGVQRGGCQASPSWPSPGRRTVHKKGNTLHPQRGAAPPTQRPGALFLPSPAAERKKAGLPSLPLLALAGQA